MLLPTAPRFSMRQKANDYWIEKINHNEKPNKTSRTCTSLSNIRNLCGCLINTSLPDLNPSPQKHTRPELNLDLTSWGDDMCLSSSMFDMQRRKCQPGKKGCYISVDHSVYAQSLHRQQPRPQHQISCSAWKPARQQSLMYWLRVSLSL